jgi:replicative DNA helicase
MPKKEYLARLLAQKTDFTFKQIWENKMTDDEYKTFMQQAYLGGKIYINSNIYITMTGIESGAMRLKEKYNLGLLIIDYLQLITSEIKGKEENREREVSKISRRCKQLAMDLDIPVVLLAQLNRASELTGDKKPRLHNLRESGAIEQDADDVILLHRDREKEKILIRSGQTKDLPAFAMVEKARNGHCNDYDLLFNGPKMLFTEPPEDIRQPAQLTIVGLPKIELPASKNWYEKDDDDNGFDDGFNEEQLF